MNRFKAAWLVLRGKLKITKGLIRTTETTSTTLFSEINVK